jgi:hypothetical protein
MPPPGVPAAPPTAPAPAPAPAGPPDPHLLGASVARLGGGARRAGRLAFAVASAVLGEGEVVECAVQGRFQGVDGAAVLTNRRLLLVNGREWKPDVVELAVDAALTVQGWQDDRTAALVFQAGDRTTTVDHVADRAVAQELAQRIRGRAAAGGPTTST